MSDFDIEEFQKLCMCTENRDLPGTTVAAEKVFAMIDANGDKVLEKNELMAFAGAIRTDIEQTYNKMMSDLDFNGDGQVDHGEWMKFWEGKASS